MNRHEFLRWSAASAAGLWLLTSRDALAGDTPAALDVTAKLVEIPSKFPPDDLYDYAYVMRYEVTAGGLPEKSSIFVAHYKPTLPRGKIKDKMKPFVGGSVRTFAVGDLHKLSLSAELKKIWKGPVIDDFAATDHKSIRYWCLKADPG